MALVLLTNSYVLATDADTYFETRLDTAAWDDASASNKDAALVQATLELDNDPFIGSSSTTTQKLAWPRKGAAYYSARFGMSITFAVDEIPDELKDAVYEQALHILANAAAVSSGPVPTFESISVGSISLSDSTSTNNSAKTSRRSTFSTKLIVHLLDSAGSAGVSGSWWRNN